MGKEGKERKEMQKEGDKKERAAKEDRGWKERERKGSVEKSHRTVSNRKNE